MQSRVVFSSDFRWRLISDDNKNVYKIIYQYQLCYEYEDVVSSSPFPTTPFPPSSFPPPPPPPTTTPLPRYGEYSRHSSFLEWLESVSSSTSFSCILHNKYCTFTLKTCFHAVLPSLICLVRYRFCRKLEEGSFAGKTADFVMMLLFGGLITLVSLLCTHWHNLSLNYWVIKPP